MTKEAYERMFQKIRSMRYGVTVIRNLGETVTVLTAIFYAAALFVSVWRGKGKQAFLICLVPAVSVFVVSCFRNWWKAERPYEIYGFQPLFPKETKGKSFPSRHVFSIFVIGSTLYWFYPLLGEWICLMGIVLAILRVMAGVHFPKDVLVGAAAGILCGCMAGLLK